MMVREVRDKADELAEGPLLRLGSRWVSLIVPPIILGLVFWLFNTVWNVDKTVSTQTLLFTAQLANQSETIKSLARRLETLSTATYSAADAQRELAIRDRLIQENEHKIAINADAIRRTGQRIDRLEAEAIPRVPSPP